MFGRILTATATGKEMRLESYPSGQRSAGNALYLFSIHGDEDAVPPLAHTFVHHLRSGSIVHRLDIHVVPAVNPDGVASRRRCNSRGVDLNRNFPATNWSSRAASPRYFPGEQPGSEPETRAVARLLEALRPEFVVSVHSPLACVNYDGPARLLADALAVAIELPLTDDIGYPTPGSLGSYAGIDLAIPTVTAELPESLESGALDRWADALIRLACDELRGPDRSP